MAHAHNDYEHARPLYDALSYGFQNVEADVYLVDGRLLVAHDRKDLRAARSLRALYLDPLAKLARAGKVHDFTLMVDVKADGTLATRQLIQELEPYRWMISTGIERAVKVVVSGAGDRSVIAKEAYRLVSIDGRPLDLATQRDPDVAWISDDWTSQFKWRGVGAFAEREKLLSMVSRAHDRGYRLRFWATPENATVWKELVTAKVDLIGTDRLADLAKFLCARQPESWETYLAGGLNRRGSPYRIGR